MWERKELALRKRFTRWHERLKEHTRSLCPLNAGDKCFLQNQHGPHPKRWDYSGTVVEVMPHHQYLVKVDGSGRLTRRNRRFLRKFEPATTTITSYPRCAVSPAAEHTAAPSFREAAVTTSEQLPTETLPPPPSPDVTASPNIDCRPRRERLPLMLRNLLPHNKPGRLEHSPC